jgi:hypothetical protein
VILYDAWTPYDCFGAGGARKKVFSVESVQEYFQTWPYSVQNTRIIEYNTILILGIDIRYTVFSLNVAKLSLLQTV